MDAEERGSAPWREAAQTPECVEAAMPSGKQGAYSGLSGDSAISWHPMIPGGGEGGLWL